MTRNTHLVTKSGVVSRVAGDSLAYIVASDGRNFCAVKGIAAISANGDSYANPLRVGDVIEFCYDAATQIVASLKVIASAAEATTTSELSESALFDSWSDEPLELLSASTASNSEISQIQLLPSDEPAGDIRVEDAIPVKTRSFGKLIDTSALQPGDLLLARDADGGRDLVSKLITDVQMRGGYASRDARWTHAAMYTGDGLSVVEATFDNILGGDVRMTTLWEYCQGTSILRIRRPVFIRRDLERWKLCIRALARLKNDYKFWDCIQMWFAVKWFRKTLGEIERKASAAVICSTLYADAFSEATGRTLGERAGACVPAWLSASSAFAEVETKWLKIL